MIETTAMAGVIEEWAIAWIAPDGRQGRVYVDIWPLILPTKERADAKAKGYRELPQFKAYELRVVRVNRDV
jgi:hypothetical protein